MSVGIQCFAHHFRKFNLKYIQKFEKLINSVKFSKMNETCGTTEYNLVSTSRGKCVWGWGV